MGLALLSQQHSEDRRDWSLQVGSVKPNSTLLLPDDPGTDSGSFIYSTDIWHTSISVSVYLSQHVPSVV